MTVNDFDYNTDIDVEGYLPAWRETKDDSFDDGWHAVDREDVQYAATVNQRFWTCKPTDEQMEATSWDD